MALMEQPLPSREIEEWRGRQARYAPRYHADAFVEFVEDREEFFFRVYYGPDFPFSKLSKAKKVSGTKIITCQNTKFIFQLIFVFSYLTQLF